MNHRTYLAANLGHEPGCQWTLPYYEMPCTCRVSDILAAWDAREGALREIEALIENSRGVCGLHANGNEAAWEDLSPGGAYEGWLESLPRALAETEGE